MKLNDAIMGALLLALAIAVLVNVQTFPKIPGQNIGPSAFPGLIAALLAGCSIALIARGLRARRTHGWIEFGAWVKSPHHVRNFVLSVACLAFYIVAADKLGFLLCGVVILATLFWTLRVRPALMVPLAIGVTLVIHLVFYKLLRVPLPWGLLPPLW